MYLLFYTFHLFCRTSLINGLDYKSCVAIPHNHCSTPIKCNYLIKGLVSNYDREG